MIKVKVAGLDDTIKHLEAKKRKTEDRMRELLERLVAIGIPVAEMHYGYARQYDPDADVVVNGPVWLDKTRLAITASGHSVLFLEFGTGISMGYRDDGDPPASAYGYGPGTWSDNPSLGGKGHWADPNGWYYAHGKKSYGNPAFRSMYHSAKEMRDRIEETAKDVFGHD